MMGKGRGGNRSEKKKKKGGGMLKTPAQKKQSHFFQKSSIKTKRKGKERHKSIDSYHLIAKNYLISQSSHLIYLTGKYLLKYLNPPPSATTGSITKSLPTS